MGLVMPPDEVFLNPRRALADNQGGYHYDNWKETICKKGEGVLVYYHDHPFPMKGHVYPEACEANNIVKKLTVGMMLCLASKEAVLPALGFLLLPYKYKIRWLEKILSNYCRMAEYPQRTHFLKREHYNRFQRELWGLASHFLRNLGISFELAERFGRILANMFYYEDAYRYRVQDVFTEMSKPAMLIWPRRELLRVMAIYQRREHIGLTEKYMAATKILSWILLVPRIKKAFLSAFRATNIDNLRLDEADEYYCLQRGDYDFMGKEEEQRKKEFMNLYNRFAVSRFKQLVKQSVTNPDVVAQVHNQLASFGI